MNAIFSGHWDNIRFDATPVDYAAQAIQGYDTFYSYNLADFEKEILIFRKHQQLKFISYAFPI